MNSAKLIRLLWPFCPMSPRRRTMQRSSAALPPSIEKIEDRLLLSTGVPYLLKDVNVNTPGSAPAWLAEVNGTVFFSADDGETGRELWKTDGTAAGTLLVKDISPSPIPNSVENLTDLNGTLFFTTNDGTNGYELWKSDGTAAGTVMVKDI